MVLTEAEIEAELDRLMVESEIDKEKVKDLEKRMIEVVETNRVIDPKNMKTIEYLEMDKLLKSMIKVTACNLQDLLFIVEKKASSSS